MKNEKKRKARCILNDNKRVKVGDSSKLSSFSINQFQERLKQKSKMIKSLKNKNKRYTAELLSVRSELLSKKGKDKNLVNSLSCVSKALMNNVEGLKEQLTKILINNGKDENIKSEKVNWIIEQISHMNNEMNGKKSKCDTHRN